MLLLLLGNGKGCVNHFSISGSFPGARNRSCRPKEVLSYQNLIFISHTFTQLLTPVSAQSMEEMGKDFCPNFSNRFLKTLTEGAVTMEAGSLFQYFTTLTEKADPLLQRWLAPWGTLEGCPLWPRRAGGRKSKFGLISKRPLNILKAVMRSSLSRPRCKE